MKDDPSLITKLAIQTTAQVYTRMFSAIRNSKKVSNRVLDLNPVVVGCDLVKVRETRAR